MVGQGQVEDDMGEGLVDASDRIEGGDVIVYWNDIEKDKRYQNWPIHPQGVSNCVFFKKSRYLLKSHAVHAPCISWPVPYRQAEYIQSHFRAGPLSNLVP